jgi:hypothetical protein
MLDPIWQFFGKARTNEQEAAPRAADENHVDQLLMDFVERSYERENEESDSIWRTLPLFPVSFGFAVALLGYAILSAPARFDDAYSRAINSLIILSALSFLPAFRWLWKMTRPRTYRYLPNDLEVLSYANSLREYHGVTAADETELDRRVAKDLKSYFLTEWAEAASRNQANNQARAHARGRTAFYLMTCIALALLTNVLILAGDKAGVLRTDKHVTRSSGGNASAK